MSANKVKQVDGESPSVESSAASVAETRQRAPLEIKMRAFSPNDQYIITINEYPVGGILSRAEAVVVVDWMRGALAELTIAFV